MASQIRVRTYLKTSGLDKARNEERRIGFGIIKIYEKWIGRIISLRNTNSQ
jgi:hypothetical protein